MESQVMEIDAEIGKKIDYNPQLCSQLTEFQFDDFRTGAAFRKSSFLLKYDDKKSFAVSRWTSPKPSRTYPHARVYDTLAHPLRLTIIPYAKDEGKAGEPDFLQWDYVSLMSLLQVFVIPGFYISARKNSRRPDKITAQNFDYQYLTERLIALATFNQSDPAHWNMDEISNQIVKVAQSARVSYEKIAKETGVELHKLAGIEKRINEMQDDLANFRTRSRRAAESARQRESKTIHIRERVNEPKAYLTIKNFIGGYYYWATDEAVIIGDKILLSEKKNSEKRKLPSLQAIKDACIRMVVFTNLTQVKVGDKEYKQLAAIGLTSDLLLGACHNRMANGDIDRFFSKNELNERDRNLIRGVFREANVNKFIAVVGASTIQIKDILSR
jgi:hypothetical protein